eukprot:UC4_evm16s805
MELREFVPSAMLDGIFVLILLMFPSTIARPEPTLHLDHNITPVAITLASIKQARGNLIVHTSRKLIPFRVKFNDSEVGKLTFQKSPHEAITVEPPDSCHVAHLARNPYSLTLAGFIECHTPNVIVILVHKDVVAEDGFSKRGNFMLKAHLVFDPEPPVANIGLLGRSWTQIDEFYINFKDVETPGGGLAFVNAPNRSDFTVEIIGDGCKAESVAGPAIIKTLARRTPLNGDKSSVTYGISIIRPSSKRPYVLHMTAGQSQDVAGNKNDATKLFVPISDASLKPITSVNGVPVNGNKDSPVLVIYSQSKLVYVTMIFEGMPPFSHIKEYKGFGIWPGLNVRLPNVEEKTNLNSSSSIDVPFSQIYQQTVGNNGILSVIELNTSSIIVNAAPDAAFDTAGVGSMEGPSVQIVVDSVPPNVTFFITKAADRLTHTLILKFQDDSDIVKVQLDHSNIRTGSYRGGPVPRLKKETFTKVRRGIYSILIRGVKANYWVPEEYTITIDGGIASDRAGNKNLEAIHIEMKAESNIKKKEEINENDMSGPVPKIHINRKKCPSNRDDCEFQEDGFCDDGGEGSISSICPLGFDLSDCGPRIFRNCYGSGAGVSPSTGVVNNSLIYLEDPIVFIAIEFSDDSLPVTINMSTSMQWIRPVYPLTSKSLENLQLFKIGFYVFSVIRFRREGSAEVVVPPGIAADKLGFNNSNSEKVKLVYDSLPPTIDILVHNISNKLESEFLLVDFLIVRIQDLTSGLMPFKQKWSTTPFKIVSDKRHCIPNYRNLSSNTTWLDAHAKFEEIPGTRNILGGTEILIKVHRSIFKKDGWNWGEGYTFSVDSGAFKDRAGHMSAMAQLVVAHRNFEKIPQTNIPKNSSMLPIIDVSDKKKGTEDRGTASVVAHDTSAPAAYAVLGVMTFLFIVVSIVMLLRGNEIRSKNDEIARIKAKNKKNKTSRRQMIVDWAAKAKASKDAAKASQREDREIDQLYKLVHALQEANDELSAKLDEQTEEEIKLSDTTTKKSNSVLGRTVSFGDGEHDVREIDGKKEGHEKSKKKERKRVGSGNIFKSLRKSFSLRGSLQSKKSLQLVESSSEDSEDPVSPLGFPRHKIPTSTSSESPNSPLTPTINVSNMPKVVESEAGEIESVRPSYAEKIENSKRGKNSSEKRKGKEEKKSFSSGSNDLNGSFKYLGKAMTSLINIGRNNSMKVLSSGSEDHDDSARTMGENVQVKNDPTIRRKNKFRKKVRREASMKVIDSSDDNNDNFNFKTSTKNIAARSVDNDYTIKEPKKMRRKVSSRMKHVSMKVASSSEDDNEVGGNGDKNIKKSKCDIIDRKTSLRVESSNDDRSPSPFKHHDKFVFTASELAKSEARRSNSQKRKKEVEGIKEQGALVTPKIIVSEATSSKDSLASSRELSASDKKSLRSVSRESMNVGPPPSKNCMGTASHRIFHNPIPRSKVP